MDLKLRGLKEFCRNIRHFPARKMCRNGEPSCSSQGKQATGENVQLAFVDQGYTGEKTARATAEHGIELEVIKLAEAKKGFLLLPKRWVVEHSFGRSACCQLPDLIKYPSIQCQ